MTPTTRLLLTLPLVGQLACLDASTIVERRVERAFDVTGRSTVRIDLSGGSVTAVTGPAGRVEIVLLQQVRTTGGDEAADRILAERELTLAQEGDDVRLVERRGRRSSGNSWSNRVQLRALVTLPPDVRLDIETRGGRIKVEGERDAEIRANTSGGSISADGGAGALILGTSGGSIEVARALGPLQADTSGGSITVDYIGPSASSIELGTSGGSIRVGLDPQAALTVSADTSGGRVEMEDVLFEGHAERHSHVNGTINGGGGGRMKVSTSGGNITVRSAADPGERSRARSPGRSREAGRLAGYVSAR